MWAMNDLSEDVRRETDNIYNAIATLSVKPTSTVRAHAPTAPSKKKTKQ